MADKQLFTNNGVSLLLNAIGPGATSLVVLPGDGALFPQPTAANEYFNITLENDTATVREIIKVYGRTGDTLTNIVRAQEGTSALFWPAGGGSDTLVDHRVTAETMYRAMDLPELGGIFDPSVTVPATTTGVTSEFEYADNRRMMKFWVQMYDPVSGNAQAFEVYTVIRGLLSTNSEFVTYTQTTRIGFNFNGNVNVQLDVINKLLKLEWINNDPTVNVIVTVTRI